MNPSDFASLGGTVVVVVVFVWYLAKKDTKSWGHIQELTKMLSNHLVETARVLAKLDGNISGLRDELRQRHRERELQVGVRENQER